MEYDLLYNYEYLETATCRILTGGGAQRIPDTACTPVASAMPRLIFKLKTSLSVRQGVQAQSTYM